MDRWSSPCTYERRRYSLPCWLAYFLMRPMYGLHALKGLLPSWRAWSRSIVTISLTVTMGGFQPPFSTPQLNQSMWPLGPCVPVMSAARSVQMARGTDNEERTGSTRAATGGALDAD